MSGSPLTFHVKGSFFPYSCIKWHMHVYINCIESVIYYVIKNTQIGVVVKRVTAGKS
jgi:hypothetical protein